MFHRRIGAIDELLPISRRAETIAPLLSEASAPIAAQAMLGVSHHIKGNLAEAYAALSVAREASVDRVALPHFYGFHREAECLIAVNLWLRGFPDHAARAAQDELSIENAEDPVTASLCLSWRVVFHHLRGDLQITDEYAARLMRLAGEHGFAPQKWFAFGLRGDLQVQRGDRDEGIRDLQELLRRLREGRYVIFVPWLTCLLAEALTAKQEAAQALRLLDDIELETATRAGIYMPEFLRVRGAVLTRLGDFEGAAHALQSALDTADAQGALSWRLRAAIGLARLHLLQGRVQEARDVLAGAYARFTEGFKTRDLRSARSLIEEIDLLIGANDAG